MTASHSYRSGAIIWAKVTTYPWWPAKVISPTPEHFKQLRIDKLKPNQYLVVFYNDNEQISLVRADRIENFTSQSTRSRALQEKSTLATRLRVAIEHADKEFIDFDEKFYYLEPSAKGTKTTPHDSPRSHPKKSPTPSAKTKHTASPTTRTPESTHLVSSSKSKNTSSNRKRRRSNDLDDFIADEDGSDVSDQGITVRNHTSKKDHRSGDEPQSSANQLHAVRRKKKSISRDRIEKKSSSRAHRISKKVKQEKKVEPMIAEYSVPTGGVDKHENSTRHVKLESSEKRTWKKMNVESGAESSGCPPSLSEEAYNSMVRDTNDFEELAKEDRFRVLMEHLREIRHSNVKQWREGYEGANESDIIQDEYDMFRAIVPYVQNARRLIRWIRKGNDKTENREKFNELVKSTVQGALGLHKLYFKLAKQELNKIGKAIHRTMKELISISKTASRSFRDVLILWHDLLNPNAFDDSLERCEDESGSQEGREVHGGTEKLKHLRSEHSASGREEDSSQGQSPHGSGRRSSGKVGIDEKDRETESKAAESKVAESKVAESKVAESKGTESKGTESKGTESKGTESKETESKETESKGTEKIEESKSLGNNSEWSTEKREKSIEKKRSQSENKKQLWKSFSRERFIRVIETQMKGLEGMVDEERIKELAMGLERELSLLFEECTIRYFRTGRLVTVAVRSLVEICKKDDFKATSDEDEGEDEDEDEMSRQAKLFLKCMDDATKLPKLFEYLVRRCRKGSQSPRDAVSAGQQGKKG